jgi:hypothetical protein
MTRHHWLADRAFAMLPNVGLTIVNPGFFADAYLQLISFASLLGVFALPVEGESAMRRLPTRTSPALPRWR